MGSPPAVVATQVKRFESLSFVHSAVDRSSATMLTSAFLCSMSILRHRIPSVHLLEGYSIPDSANVCFTLLTVVYQPHGYMRMVANIILFGDAGIGKSSVINLIAGKDVVKISPDG